MSFYAIRTLYIRELRAALRERGIVLNSLLVPMLVYPVLLWLGLSLVGFIQGREERHPSRVALISLPAAHVELADHLAQDDGPMRVEALGEAEVEALGEAEIETALRAGELDVAAIFEPAIFEQAAPVEAAGEKPNFAVTLLYDSSSDRSRRARQRFESALADYRAEWRDDAATARGIDTARWAGWRLERRNVASGEDIGAFLLALAAPMLMMVMIAVGCFYPAVDATAGERERSTWETSLTLGVTRSEVLAAKYLYVATFGAVAGLLNLGALAVTLGALFRGLAGAEAEAVSFAIPLRALPILAIATFAFALMVAAGMMLFAVFARTFKEGQSMITPVYLLALLPPLLVAAPDLTLDLGWAFVPVAGLCLLFRQVLVGELDAGLAAIVFAVQGAMILALLLAARWVMAFEDVMTGSYRGSLGRLLTERWRGRRERREDGRASS